MKNVWTSRVLLQLQSLQAGGRAAASHSRPMQTKQSLTVCTTVWPDWLHWSTAVNLQSPPPLPPITCTTTCPPAQSNQAPPETWTPGFFSCLVAAIGKTAQIWRQLVASRLIMIWIDFSRTGFSEHLTDWRLKAGAQFVMVRTRPGGCYHLATYNPPPHLKSSPLLFIKT